MESAGRGLLIHNLKGGGLRKDLRFIKKMNWGSVMKEEVSYFIGFIIF